MAKTPKNHGKPWTPQQDAQFIREVQQNTPTRILGLHLGAHAGCYSSARAGTWRLFEADEPIAIRDKKEALSGSNR